MPYTAPWDETQPPGSAQAATLKTIIQNLKRDIRERLLTVGIDFTVDPVTAVVPSVLARGVSVTNTTTHTTSVTPMAWDTERYDTDSFHDPVTNNSRLVVPAGLAGTYVISARVSLQAASLVTPSTFGLRIRKNGATLIGSVRERPVTVNNDYSMHVMCLEKLIVTDYVETIFLQEAGADLASDNAAGGSAFAVFEMLRIGV